MLDIQETTLLPRSFFKSAFSQNFLIEETLITSVEVKNIQFDSY